MDNMNQRATEERRNSARRTLYTDVFIVFRPHFDRLGKLKDVSHTGAAFEYPVFATYDEVFEVEVDLFTSEPSHFMLRSVPCRVVYDIKVAKPTLSGVETRRCGLKFESLSPHHAEQLSVFFRTYVSPSPSGA
jgi:hypothetical protein